MTKIEAEIKQTEEELKACQDAITGCYSKDDYQKLEIAISRLRRKLVRLEDDRQAELGRTLSRSMRF